MNILVGISGGVDSAYAALRLMQMGHTVEGAILRMHEHTDLAAAREVADSLGIPLHTVDCTREFDSIVKADMVNEYVNGRTPNPCIICNERVKFAILHSYALSHGFDRIATGHYAGIDSFLQDGELRYALLRGDDQRKDQSYMLYRLPQHILSSLILPLAGESKSNVRAGAEQGNIPVADRPDSQEICFLPNGGHAEFVESRNGKCPEGDFVDVNGKILGKHKGIIHYTVGQRKGLGIALGERCFVTHIDPETNRITLSPSLEGVNTVLLTRTVYSGILPPTSEQQIKLLVKLRYTAPLTETLATLRSDGSVLLTFDQKVKAAPGQSAVLYLGNRVALGGIITAQE